MYASLPTDVKEEKKKNLAMYTIVLRSEEDRQKERQTDRQTGMAGRERERE